MIDFAIGMIFGALIVAAYFHFKAPAGLKATPSLDLETVVEAVRGLVTAGTPKVEDFAATLEQRIDIAMSQAGDAIVQKLQSATADLDQLIASKTSAANAALETATADHASDLTNIGQAADALAAKLQPG